MSQRLGTLTLDLVAKIGKFIEPMTKADIEAQKRLKNIKKNAKEVTKAFKAMNVGIITSASLIVQNQVQIAKELQRNSNLAGVNVVQFQKLSQATKSVGIEGEQLADILKDVQEKFGEFAATGGGGAKDFFEEIAPKVGVTIEQFQKLSGAEGLQLYKDSLDKAGVPQKQQIFYLESLASDTAKLLPLLRQGGNEFKELGAQAEKNGIIMDQFAIQKAILLGQKTDQLKQKLGGLKNQLAEELIPTFHSLADSVLSVNTNGETTKVFVKTIGGWFRWVTKIALGAAAALDYFTTGARLLSNAFNKKEADKVRAELSQKLDMWSHLISSVDKTNTGINSILTAGESYYRAHSAISDTRKEIDAYTLSGLKAVGMTNAQTKALEKQNKTIAKSKLLSKSVSDAILYGSSKLGVNPNDLAAVISFETAGTFSTNARNPKGSATGLIQFMQYTDGTNHGGNKNKWDYYGMSRNQFGALLPMQQMEYVVKFLKGKGIKPGSGLGDIYSAVAGWGYKKGSKAYSQNKVWDANKDGYIAKGEAVKAKRFRQHIKNYFEDGVATQQKAIQDINKSQIELMQSQAQLRKQQDYEYADEKRRIELKLAEDINKIQSAHHKPETQQKYIDIARKRAAEQLEQINKTETAKAQSFKNDIANLQKYKLTQQAIIKQNFAGKRAALALETQLTKAQKQQKLTAINELEAYQLKKFELRQSYEYTRLNSSHTTALNRIREEYAYRRKMLDLDNSLSPKNKARALDALNNNETLKTNAVQKRAARAFAKQTSNLQGNSALYSLDQNKAQQEQVANQAFDAEIITKEEHAARLLEIDRNYWTQKNDLYLAQGQTVASTLTGVMGNLVSKNSKAYRVMFAMEKGMAIARSVMAIKTAIAQAFSLPFPSNLGAVATVASQTANIVGSIKSIRQPVVSQAHGGLDYVPREETYLLQKGEAVIMPRQNTRLQKFLDKEERATAQAQPQKVIINNYTGEPVSQRRNKQGDLEIMVGREVAKQLPRQVEDPNSSFNKSFKRNYNMERKTA